MSVKFSVIVPIYNASLYLQECIDSVLEQTYKEYELILVDDGSTDDSFEICKKYASIFENVKIYTKENEGLSATRNFGISVCSGDYVVFLDSDDYIEKESLFKFNYVIENSGSVDVIACYAYHFDKSGEKKKSRPFLEDVDSSENGIEFFRKSLYQNNMRACAPFYITSRKLIERENLQFRVGLFHEDELWTPILLASANKVVDLKYYFYNYRLSNNQSITRDPSKKEKRALDRITISLELEKYFSIYQEKKYNSFHDNISAQYMYGVYDGNLAYRKHSINRFFPLLHAKTPRYILKSLVFAFSPKMACKLRTYK